MHFVFCSGMIIVHYLQGITKNLALGSELLYQRGIGKQQAIVTFAGKYESKYRMLYSFIILDNKIPHFVVMYLSK